MTFLTKWFTLVLLLLCATLALTQSPPPNGLIGYGINSYFVPPKIRPSFDTWLFNNYQLVVTGSLAINKRAYRGTTNAWVGYVDGCCIYGKDIYQYVLSTAAAQRWSDPEGPLLHMNIDYRPSTTFSGIDQFDAYEQSFSESAGLPSNAVNGVFTLTGKTYRDVTVQSYCPTSVPTDGGCASYRPNPVTVSDRLLIGYQVPFDTVNITLHNPRSEGTVTWQYWNGSSFSSLTLATDTTSGLTATGTVTFLPPSDWVPSVVHGSRPKYWVQITVSGVSTKPSLAKIYGDTLLSACSSGSGQCARGWNPSACVSGHINVGTPVEYCGTPHSGSTAKFRQQARALGYGGAYNDFFGNPINVQNSQNTWAYVEKARTAVVVGSSGMNGVMFDDGGCPPQHTPSFASTSSDLGSTSYVSATTTMFQTLHKLLTATYGSNPRWWDGMNSCQVDSTFEHLYTSMNWMASELHNQTVNSISMDTHSSQYLCTDSVWCPGSPTSNNPNNTVELRLIQDYTQFGVRDGNGSALSNYHLWDMSQRGPMNALAMYYMVKNPNILFGYDPAGFIYFGSDDYYYWVKSARTVAAPGVVASTCNPGPCVIPLSGDLEISTCPDMETEGCPLRLGGVDVVGTKSYTRNRSGNLITQDQVFGAILHSYLAGASIEYAVRGCVRRSPCTDSLSQQARSIWARRTPPTASTSRARAAPTTSTADVFGSTVLTLVAMYQPAILVGLVTAILAINGVRLYGDGTSPAEPTVTRLFCCGPLPTRTIRPPARNTIPTPRPSHSQGRTIK
jgi:hypothetical protein